MKYDIIFLIYSDVDISLLSILGKLLCVWFHLIESVMQLVSDNYN